MLRTVPPDKVVHQLHAFDDGLRRSLERILCCSVCERSWLQASLPLLFGGLGLRASFRTAPAAFLASCHSSFPLIQQLLSGCSFEDLHPHSIPGVQSAFEFFQNFLPNWSTPDSPTQTTLQAALDADQLHQLLNASTIRDRAHLNSIYTGQFTSSWLQAIPNPNLGLAIVGCEFTCALRYWLSIPFFDSSHLCSCGSTLDPHGDHLLGCGQGPLRIRRHDVLTYILFQALLQDNHQVKREQRIFSSSAVRPGDIFHPDFSDGKPTYFDVSVRNSLLPHFLSRASLVAGVASSAGEMDKDAKYNHNVSSAGCVFFPLVVETLGLWTDSSISLLRRIAARTTLRSGVSQGQAFHNLLQQLSVKLWSYNAKMLLRHISLLPVTESDSLDQSLFSLESSSHCNDVNFNGIPCGAVGSGGSPVYSQVSESSSSLNISHSIVPPEVSLGVPVRNRFALMNVPPPMSCLFLVMRKL